jgi:hypothetical protein
MWVTPYVDENGVHVDAEKPYVIPSGILELVVDELSENQGSGENVPDQSKLTSDVEISL